jgi:hypothetical protein
MDYVNKSERGDICHRVMGNEKCTEEFHVETPTVDRYHTGDADAEFQALVNIAVRGSSTSWTAVNCCKT